MIDNGRNDKCLCGSYKKFKKCCLPYSENANNSEKKILLYVGNGFTLNFLKKFNIELKSSEPLTEFNSEEIDYNDIFHHYEEIKNFLSEFDLDNDQFKIIDEILKSYGNDKTLRCYFNRFLTLAYSKFQLELNKYDKLSDWELCKWIHVHRNHIISIVSLNYDLHLENTIKEAGGNYRRKFTDERQNSLGNCINIYKPHGSIDFDLLDNLIRISDEGRWKMVTEGNISRKGNEYQQVLTKDRWLVPRIQSDIIPPSQHNNMMDYSWIKESYSSLKTEINDVDCIVNLGFSYSEADRTEYNELIKSIRGSKKIQIFDFNTKPNIELERYLNLSGHEYKFIGLRLPWRILDII